MSTSEKYLVYPYGTVRDVRRPSDDTEPYLNEDETEGQKSWPVEKALKKFLKSINNPKAYFQLGVVRFRTADGLDFKLFLFQGTYDQNGNPEHEIKDGDIIDFTDQGSSLFILLDKSNIL
ncbi:hypothetical protein GCM10007049_28570 [Echinicola pacifica]|uniref:Uncharacterized protein n=1 Tax=Echinicola pacifica TaxID=346377 RepID=A0A918Q7F7_9BACT|nr:hypothetical protein [Echinicola pacifica]GGZ33213.1 hypothetical protein GCM10007049_28570 [Echinicola pacifica]